MTPTMMGTQQQWLIKRLGQPFYSECVIWPFKVNKGGYPRMNLEGRKRMVAHIVLEFFEGPQPSAPNNKALHSCDTPACINHRHLSWGSQTENIRQMDERKRRNNQVLSEEDIPVVRAIRTLGFSLKNIADMFQVSVDTIHKIDRGITWRHA